MEALWACLLFCSNIFDDILAVLYIRRVAEGKYWQAGLLSMALVLVVALSVVSYVEDKGYLIPVALGSGAGAVIGTWWDRRRRGLRMEKSSLLRCDLCGRFISFKDFENGTAIRRMLTPDSEYSQEEWETRCPKCVPQQENQNQ